MYCNKKVQPERCCFEKLCTYCGERKHLYDDFPHSNSINSPMVGTFYASASPGAKPFVSVGDLIKEGDVVCIVEAMKMMNEIKSEFTGTVLAVNVENAEPVEYGQSLIEISK